MRLTAYDLTRCETNFQWTDVTQPKTQKNEDKKMKKSSHGAMHPATPTRGWMLEGRLLFCHVPGRLCDANKCFLCGLIPNCNPRYMLVAASEPKRCYHRLATDGRAKE